MLRHTHPALQNLLTTLRPAEVAAWIKNKKKEVPPEVNPDTYSSSFMTWWFAIQPTWRLSDNASFVYEAPPDEDWRLLCKGGSAGLYTVVVALSWWIRALPLHLPCLRAWSAVRDVQWVIDQIYNMVLHTTKGIKQGREDLALQAPQSNNTKR